MPVTTFSRRKNSSRRQNSSDIEEDRPSQSRADEQVDEDEDEDDQPRRRTNGVKKEKKPSTSSRRAETARPKDEDTDGEADNGEDDDDDKIDIANFQDQPIAKADMKKLLGLSQDWNQMEKLIRQHWKVIGEAAVSMAEAAEGNDAEEVGHIYQFLVGRISFFIGT